MHLFSELVANELLLVAPSLHNSVEFRLDLSSRINPSPMPLSPSRTVRLRIVLRMSLSWFLRMFSVGYAKPAHALAIHLSQVRLIAGTLSNALCVSLCCICHLFKKENPSEASIDRVTVAFGVFCDAATIIFARRSQACSTRVRISVSRGCGCCGYSRGGSESGSGRRGAHSTATSIRAELAGEG